MQVLPEILIEVDEADLQVIEEKAKEERRSRRQQISHILAWWVEMAEKKNA